MRSKIQYTMGHGGEKAQIPSGMMEQLNQHQQMSTLDYLLEKSKSLFVKTTAVRFSVTSSQ